MVQWIFDVTHPTGLCNAALLAQMAALLPPATGCIAHFLKKTHKAFATNLQANDLKCPARPRQLPVWPLPALTGLRLDEQEKAEKNQFLYT